MALFHRIGLFQGSFNIHDIKRPWETLQIFSLYRLYLLIILIVLYTLKLGDGWAIMALPRLTIGAITIYVVFSLLCVVFVKWRSPEFNTQVFMQVIGDFIILGLLAYASGGIGSGLGILMNTSIAAGSILTVGRMAQGFAFIASLVLAVVQFMVMDSVAFDLMQYGILVVSFFATALLGSVLAKRISYTEALADKRGVDLANLAQLNEHIIQHMQSGIVVIDPLGKVCLINESARRLLGLGKSLIGHHLGEVSQALLAYWEKWQYDHHFSAEAFQAVATGPELIPKFSALHQSDGTAALIFLDDASRIMQQAQQIKLASLGRLTASIAHEIRNPLGAISHAAQLLQESTELLSKSDRSLIDIIQTHCERVNTVIKSILQLSRRELATPVYLKLKPWLEAFINELHVSELESPQVALEVVPEDIEVYIDPGQLRQVMTNLCENGLRYSKKQTGRSSLLIRAGFNEPAHELFLEVIDQGPGIKAEIATQIFEPFFTSEEAGTGLGLYLAKELCEANRARLDFVPLETQGSCFRISFREATSLTV